MNEKTHLPKLEERGDTYYKIYCQNDFVIFLLVIIFIFAKSKKHLSNRHISNPRDYGDF